MKWLASAGQAVVDDETPRARVLQQWLLATQAGRTAAAALLVGTSVAFMALAYRVEVGRPLFFVALALPSATTLLAFIVGSTVLMGRTRLALAAGLLAYLGVGILLAAVMEAVGRGGGSLYGIFIWPTVTLAYMGPLLGWWPGPE